MKHKFRNLCMISFLAIAGIFGISSTIINNKAQDTPVAEKAEADAWHVVGGQNFYLDCRNFSTWVTQNSSVKFKIYFSGSGGSGCTSQRKVDTSYQ